MTGVLYASSGQLLDRLGMVEGDDREGAFIDCLEAASRWIDTQCGRRFYTLDTPETRYYTLYAPWRNGGISIEVDEFVSLTTLQTDNNGDGIHETTWTVGTDFYLGPRNAPALGRPYKSLHRVSATGRYYFPAYEEGIKVTASFGYSASVPPEIRELCLVSAEMLARNVLDAVIPGAESYKLGSELQISMRSPDLTPMARRIIALYRDREYVT
jgi:hypothetical protein